MEIKVLKETGNPSFRRKEVRFEVKHAGIATPDRYSIRQALASKMKADLNLVYILEAVTVTGTQKTVGKADVYQDAELPGRVVPRHILTRNLSPEERAKLAAKEKEKPEAPVAQEPKKTEKEPAKPKDEKPQKAEEKPPSKEKS
ncbi:MAG: hypothetical protein V1857_04575 [archaeon]